MWCFDWLDHPVTPLVEFTLERICSVSWLPVCGSLCPPLSLFSTPCSPLYSTQWMAPCCYLCPCRQSLCVWGLNGAHSVAEIISLALPLCLPVSFQSWCVCVCVSMRVDCGVCVFVMGVVQCPERQAEGDTMGSLVTVRAVWWCASGILTCLRP